MKRYVGYLILLALGVLLLSQGCSVLGSGSTPVPTGPVHADFYAEPTSCTGGCWIDFTSTSSGDITKLEWDFGCDGKVDANGDSARWYYRKNGYHSVCLMVTGPDSQDTMVKTDYIEISGC